VPVRVVYLLIYARTWQLPHSASSVNTLIVLGSGRHRYTRVRAYECVCDRSLYILVGGHTMEMLKLFEKCDHKRFRPLVYVTANTDRLSEDKARDCEVSDLEEILYLPLLK